MLLVALLNNSSVNSPIDLKYLMAYKFGASFAMICSPQPVGTLSRESKFCKKKNINNYQLYFAEA